MTRPACQAGDPADRGGVSTVEPLLAIRSEAQEGDVVEIALADAVHLWAGDFDDEHFGEELDGGAEQTDTIGLCSGRSISSPRR
jgi:hypothetical protein